MFQASSGTSERTGTIPTGTSQPERRRERMSRYRRESRRNNSRWRGGGREREVKETERKKREERRENRRDTVHRLGPPAAACGIARERRRLCSRRWQTPGKHRGARTRSVAALAMGGGRVVAATATARVAGGGAFRPTAMATTHDRGGYGRPGRDIELVARGGRATGIDSSAPETKARGLRRRVSPSLRNPQQPSLPPPPPPSPPDPFAHLPPTTRAKPWRATAFTSRAPRGRSGRVAVVESDRPRASCPAMIPCACTRETRWNHPWYWFVSARSALLRS